jgi:hypothetical protein
MTRRFGRFLRQNTIALLALFFALSGTTFAAANVVLPKNSVGTKQLKKNAVTGVKIKNNQVTGADVKESSLGKVPSARNADNATDSANLGGVAASNYQRPGAVLQSGQTEHGVFAGGGGTNDYINVQVQFDPALPADLDAAHTILVTGASATHCPGTGQAEAGYLCWYEKNTGNSSFLNFGNPVAASVGASKEGMNVFYTTSGIQAYVYGEWAVAAP